MRFQLGSIPNSPDFTPDTSWRALREPSPWLLQFIALPVGVIAAVLIGVLWLTITPLGAVSFEPAWWSFLLAFAGIAVVHEMIHAAVHPFAGFSARSIIGFWPSRLILYAHYDGELSRRRFAVILLMPFLVISLLPLLIAAAAHLTSVWMAFVSTLNALLACVDLLGTGMVLFQIPAKGIVRNQGWKTYWTRSESFSPAASGG